MSFSKTTFTIIFIPVLCFSILLITLIYFPIYKYPIQTLVSLSNSVLVDNGNIDEGLSNYLIDSINLEVPTETTINIPTGYTLDLSAALPNFVSQNGNELIINASKGQVGVYDIYLDDPLSDLYNESFYIELVLNYKKIDTNIISKQIQSFLGDQVENYGVSVYDLNRHESFGFNQETQFRAASMVKVPVAITLMKEIEEGRLSLNTVYPLKADLVFNNTVGAGSYEIGTPLTIRDYLASMIIESDNTSLSHIDAILSGIYGSNLNQKIKSITGVEFYVNPPEASPKDIVTVLKGLNSNNFLTENSSKYIINLMRNALPDLKEGIALGLPVNVTYANKIGFLDTDEDLSFMDSAIVYGSTTDYVIVVMNKNQNWDIAKQNIKQISTIIYNNLN